MVGSGASSWNGCDSHWRSAGMVAGVDAGSSADGPNRATESDSVEHHPNHHMHDALLIYEVLDCIVHHLAQDLLDDVCDEETAASQRALAALARTCRAFSVPALDALWCRLDSLEPFMLCLSAYDDGRMVWWFLHRAYNANSSLSLHLTTKGGVLCHATPPECKNSSSMMKSL